MAFDPTPSVWLGAGYSLSSSVAGFNTNTAGSNKLLVQLTDALANATTGNIRSIMMAMCEAYFQAWQTQGTSAQPTKMTISRSTTTGPASTTVFTYTFKFTVNASTFAVASE